MQGAGVFRLLLFWPASWMNGVCCGKMDSGGVAVNGVLCFCCRVMSVFYGCIMGIEGENLFNPACFYILF